MIFAHLIQTASSLPTDASALESSISALESEIKALDSSSLPLEHRLWGFTALVALGVAMEFWVIWREHRDEWKAFSLGLVRLADRPSTKKYVVELLSVFFITAGIVGELWIGIEITSIDLVLRSKNSDLRNKSDQLVSLLHVELAKLESQNLELKKIVAWRTVSEEQVKILRQQLKSVRGSTLFLQWPEADPEVDEFANLMKDALHNAGLDISNALGQSATILGIHTGFSITIEPCGMPTSGANPGSLAVALENALVAAKLANRPIPRISTNPGPCVVLNIGPRGHPSTAANAAKRM